MRVPTFRFDRVTGITLVLVPLIYMVVYAVLFTPNYSEQIKTVVITAIMGALLMGILGYWLDTSAREARKDEPPHAPSSTTTTTVQLPDPEAK